MQNFSRSTGFLEERLSQTQQDCDRLRNQNNELQNLLNVARERFEELRGTIL